MEPRPFIRLKGIWFASTCLLLAVKIVTLLQFYCFHKVSWVLYATLSATLLVAVAVAPIVLGALVALIPFTRSSYRSRLAMTWPICYALTALYVSWSVLNIANIMVAPISSQDYGDALPAMSSDCLTIREGTFEHPNFWIERKGSIQIEHNKLTDDVDTLNVEWISSCEYRLTNPRKPDEHRYIKITDVTTDGYECVAKGIFSSFGETMRFELKRKK